MHNRVVKMQNELYKPYGDKNWFDRKFTFNPKANNGAGKYMAILQKDDKFTPTNVKGYNINLQTPLTDKEVEEGWMYQHKKKFSSGFKDIISGEMTDGKYVANIGVDPIEKVRVADSHIGKMFDMLNMPVVEDPETREKTKRSPIRKGMIKEKVEKKLW